MKFMFLAIAMFCVSVSAHATTKYKLTCVVNTYNADGSDFRSLVASNYEIPANKVTEVYRTKNAKYSALARESGDTHEIFLEVKSLSNDEVITAADSDWKKDNNAINSITTYSSKVEPSVTTMFQCEFSK